MLRSNLSSYFSTDGLNKLVTKFRDFFYKENVRTALATLGIAVTLYHSARCLKHVARTLTYSTAGLNARYGLYSWVVVTGASDGLGRAFCLELASQGFNIVLIDKSKIKLEGVQKEISLIRREAQSLIIPVDFSSCFQERFFEGIYDQIKHLDISMLINNVGILQDKVFNLLDPKIAFDHIAINIHVQTMMTKILIESFLHRMKRTAIVNVSSIGADFVSPRDALYVATKKYVDIQTKVLQDEYSEKIDILNLKPGYILNHTRPDHGEDLKTVPVLEYARSALSRLGKVNESHGHWKHELTYCIWNTVPTSWVLNKNLCSGNS